MSLKSTDVIEFENSSVSFKAALTTFLAILVGTLLAAWILPNWLPGLTSSLLSAQPKAFWYLSRGSAMAGYWLLWLSMVFGLLITNKLARLWPGGPTAFDIHEYVSLLGLGFGFFHALVLMGDQYINYTLSQILVPFASSPYRPVWVGLGQTAFYIWLLVNLSFYGRRWIGNRLWRLIHFLSFLTFMLVLVHGIASGTDSAAMWSAWMYWVSAGSLLFLTVYRILATQISSRPKGNSLPVNGR
jgi:predicted ferric reductase